ncbi:hypothetical protein IFM89_022750 [Coptis chinensis]|uniref:Uncharacterized protein n=1 Tax=Coptis chinensis TaxID=261450 RepID=A0A835LZ96_9MAGN|nr:hypothetical protein IFM89_022750 [Coptis chinensis]
MLRKIIGTEWRYGRNLARARGSLSACIGGEGLWITFLGLTALRALTKSGGIKLDGSGKTTNILITRLRWSGSLCHPASEESWRRSMEYKRTLSLVFILSCNIFLCGCSSGGGLEETNRLYSDHSLRPATAIMVQHWCDEMLLPLEEEVAKRALLDGLESFRFEYLACPSGLLLLLNNLEEMKIKELETNHFVLVHGGGFGPWCWYKTITHLEEGGFKVDAIDLTGSEFIRCDTNSITSLIEYVKPLTNFLKSLERAKGECSTRDDNSCTN